MKPGAAEVTEPGAVGTGSKTQLGLWLTERINESRELNPYPARYRERFCTGALPHGRVTAPYLRLVSASVKNNQSP